eukprot:349588-Chlamydomonas_euryale.AAC.3
MQHACSIRRMHDSGSVGAVSPTCAAIWSCQHGAPCGAGRGHGSAADLEDDPPPTTQVTALDNHTRLTM